MTKQFNSKNGLMDLNEKNISYAAETLFYRIGNLTKQLYSITSKQNLPYVFGNLFGMGITKDMYISALMLHLFDDESEATIPVSYNGMRLVLGPNKVSDLKIALNRLFVGGAGNDTFSVYRGVEFGQQFRYSELSTEHKIGAIARRITLLPSRNMTKNDYASFINSSFNMEVFCALDSEVIGIYNFLNGEDE